MKKYYVDVENVSRSWLSLIGKLSGDDEVALYTSKNTSVHYGDLIAAMPLIQQGRLDIRDCYVRGAGDSALDYFLMGEACNDLRRRPGLEAVIVSKDRGYDSFVAEMEGMDFKAERMELGGNEDAGACRMPGGADPARSDVNTSPAGKEAAAFSPEAIAEAKVGGKPLRSYVKIGLLIASYRAKEPSVRISQTDFQYLADRLIAHAGDFGEALADVCDEGLRNAMDRMVPDAERERLKGVIVKATECAMSRSVRSAADAGEAPAKAAEKAAVPAASGSLRARIRQGLEDEIRSNQGSENRWLPMYDCGALADAFINAGGDFKAVLSGVSGVLPSGETKQMALSRMVTNARRKALREIVRAAGTDGTMEVHVSRAEAAKELKQPSVQVSITPGTAGHGADPMQAECRPADAADGAPGRPDGEAGAGQPHGQMMQAILESSGKMMDGFSGSEETKADYQICSRIYASAFAYMASHGLMPGFEDREGTAFLTLGIGGRRHSCPARTVKNILKAGFAPIEEALPEAARLIREEEARIYAGGKAGRSKQA